MRQLYLPLWILIAVMLGISTASMAEEAVPATGEPTPVTEFAPNDSRPSRHSNYDQGLTINKVTIEGNRLIDENKIKDAMLTKPGSLYSKKNLQADLRRVYDLGYFTEKIKAVPISTNEGIHLRIEVEENAPVTGINIEGNAIISDEELLKVFTGQTGMPQNIGQLNDSIEKIEKLYAEKGYVLARVKNIQDDPDGTINLEVNEGYVDKIQLVGNRKTKDYVLKRMMSMKTGDVYNEKQLAEDLKRLYSTQAFSDVRRIITASPDDPEKYNLTVEVDEKKTGAISLGGGVDTGTGLFGSVGYTDPNFLGRGQNFNSGISVGSGIIARDRTTQANARTYQFDVGWSSPSLYGTANALSVNAYGRDLASFNVPLGVERRVGLETVWSRPLYSVKNTSLALSLRGENVRMRDFASSSFLTDNNISKKDRDNQLKGGTFIGLTPTIAYDTRNNRFNPSSGWYNTLSMTGAYGVGASSYGTVSTNLRRYFKIRDGVTLALNTQAGTSLLGDIPEFNMFRMGGAYSVRGFQEGGLGTGNGFMMASAEVRTKIPFLDQIKNFPFANNVGAAFFADAGTLINQSSLNKAFDRSGYGMSVGAGLRLNIPGLGPIRVDYAFPIAGITDKDYVRNFNFGVGQKF